MPQVNTVSALTKFLQDREDEVDQCNGCTFQSRLPHAGQPARKLDKRGMATVIEMMLRPSPSCWLVRLLSIEGLAVEQDASLIQDRLVSLEKFLALASLN